MDIVCQILCVTKRPGVIAESEQTKWFHLRERDVLKRKNSNVNGDTKYMRSVYMHILCALYVTL